MQGWCKVVKNVEFIWYFTRIVSQSSYKTVRLAKLILSQTTNFRLSQTKRVRRRQLKVWWEQRKVLWMDRKQCGKRRNCSLRAIYTFPTVFFKRLVLQTGKTQGFFVKGLIFGTMGTSLPKTSGWLNKESHVFRPGGRRTWKHCWRCKAIFSSIFTISP